MPCNSDYLEPTFREKELQRAANLLVYVNTFLHRLSPVWLLKEAENVYASDERCVTELCAILKDLSAPVLDKIVYDAHSPMARDLADWWEKHQAADVERERQTKMNEEHVRLQESALAKLTSAEREALGF